MKKILLILIALTISPSVVFAAPEVRYERTLLPTETNTYELGTSSLRWLNIFGKNGFFENITVTGTCTGCGGGGGGGISSSTNPLMATYFVATSTTATSTFPNINISTALSIFGNYVNSLTGLKSLINYWTLSGTNLIYTGGNVGIGTSTPGTTLGVQGRGLFSNDVVASNYRATSTTATSTFPQISSSVISSAWGSFTRLFVSGRASDVGKYAVWGTDGELLATTTPQTATIINISGSINDTNTTFTAASEPLLLVINGVTYASTGGAYTWTYSGGIITLNQPVGTNGSIFGISLGLGLVAMINDPYVFYVPVISGDPTAVLQTYINTASALATSTGRTSTLKFPTTEYVTDQLTVQASTVWDCTNTIFKKRSDAVGQVNASLLATARYTVGGSYYGHNGDITLKGCTFNSNNKTLGQSILKMWDVENFVFDDIEIQHTPLGLQHAINICGRGVRGSNSRVKNGTETVQDGFHINCGDNMTFTNLVCEQSGDDCLALGRDIAGPSNLGEDEGISNIAVNGILCNSYKGRCTTIYAGHDFIVSGYANVRKISNVTINGATGVCGQVRSHCFAILDEMDYGQIYSYTIASGGTGYTSGTYLAQATTGGGCTTQPSADVIITGGIITSVKPANLGSSAFSVGDGCTSSPTLSLTGLGAGAGASVTGDMRVIDTSLVRNISFQGKLTAATTTATHDEVQAYGMYITTGKDVDLDIDMTFASTTASHRPWTIYCGDNYNVKWTQTGTTTHGGWIYPSSWGCSTENWKWHNGKFQTFDGVTNSGEGIFYFRGGTNDSWSITNNTFQDLTSGVPVIAMNSTGATTTNLQVIGNTAYEISSGASNSRFLNQQSCVNCTSNLIMEHNNITNVDIPINSETAFQNSNSSYRIRDNLGVKSSYCQQATVTAGSTSTVLTVGVRTGLTTSAALGAGHIKAQLLGTIYATTSPTVNVVSTTTYAVGFQSPVSSNQTIMSCEDASIKPLN